MGMNQHYSSDSTSYWTFQPETEYQPLLMQASQPNPTPSPLNCSWPSQLYRSHRNCFDSSNSRELNSSSISYHRCRTDSPPVNLKVEEEEVEIDAKDGNRNFSSPPEEYEGEGRGAVREREPMFEKPLTPSDVGKLNRLVIPKQNAEKYFPLSRESDQQKGLLLSFEDELGKYWKFRYSYWNSSQSYVLTKGWSRYVKEKRLEAGDIVLFERDAKVGQRLYIGWRRRRQQKDHPSGTHINRAAAAAGDGSSWNHNINRNTEHDGVDMAWSQAVYSAHSYHTHQPPPMPYPLESLHAGKEVSIETTPSTALGRSSKQKNKTS